jgi:hypothetical protein
MRNMLILVIFIFCASICFGEWSLEFTGGIPSYSSFSDDEYEIYNGYSFGISQRIKIVNKFGIGIHSNFMYFPEILSGEGNESMTIKGKDCELLFGFDFLLGPSFLLYDDGKLRVPITIGSRAFGMAVLMSIDVPPEYQYLSPKKPEAEFFHYTYGIGFSISLEYHFTKWFYVIGRVQGGLDFVYLKYSEIRIQTASGTYAVNDEKYGFTKMSSISPQIGIGIQF